mmetsp:Transcript_9038/g.20404  ORF Transcript_9038/g.20404 Transcript_9038/m.20404 type:complete len:305 (+) Transcript_9038:232-1146(+)
MKAKSQPNEADSIGTLPTRGSATAQSEDVENLAAYKGQGVLNEEDQSYFDDTIDKEATTTEIVSSHQPCWKKHKFFLLGTVSVFIIGVIIIMGVIKPHKKGSNSSTRAEGNGIDTELLQLSEAPTLSPTAPPTVPPQWDINYLGLTADFGINSVNEVIVEYEIGINRVLETEILATDCLSPITGISLNSTIEREPKNGYLELLSLRYSIDKSMITGSNIWDAATDKLRFCQVVRLVFPSETGSGPAWVILEDKRKLDVTINLKVNFGSIGFEVELSSGGGPSSSSGVGVPSSTSGGPSGEGPPN